MENEEIIKKIVYFIENNEINNAKNFLENVNSADFPSILENIDDEKMIMVYRILSKEKAAEVFVELDSENQEKLINCLTDREIKNVINKLFMDDVVDLIEEMPANVVKRILENTSLPNREIINELLKYPKDTAGALMTTEFIELKENMTVEKAFEVIKNKGLKKETVYNCYVLTSDRKLLGVVDIKALLVSDNDKLVKEIMDTNVIKTYTLDDQEDVAKLFEKYDIVAIPVVDKEERLVGIITIDDAVDVMQEETAEDFQLMAGITSNSDDSYFKTSVFTHTKNRIFWLLLLMLSATLTGTVMNNFENAIATLPILVSFIPMLMDTGGNCGSQTSTLIIRGLATDEILTKDFLKVIWKELRIALLVGSVLGITNGIRIAIQYKNIPIAIVVAITIICIVVASKLIGGMLPIIAKKMKLDPALMASPIITTIVDVFSILVFFGLSTVILKI